jgi:Glucodextranase, domain B/PASTA domain
MTKFSAAAVVILAFFAVPAFASADPTSSHITVPATTAYVTFDKQNPGTLHVEGTTSGGTGNVDLRCYYGGKSYLIGPPVQVNGGVFKTDVQLGVLLVSQWGKPFPFCMLRAVPTGTTPSGAPDLPSSWEGVFIGWGQRRLETVGNFFPPTPPDTVDNYVISRAQSHATSNYNSVGFCGLCETYLFVPGSQAVSRPIWGSDAKLSDTVPGTTDRTSVRIDGADAYTGGSASGTVFLNNPGFPAVTQTSSVDPATGDLTIKERSPYTWCGPDRFVYPALDANCPTLAATGVEFERDIRQTDAGQLITIVDHWKSVDGAAHQLDAIYQDTEVSIDPTAGHGGRLNFTWTPDGFSTYAPNTPIASPPSVPASVLVKTDVSTGIGGDNMNPYGAMTFGTKPSEIKVLGVGDGVLNGVWLSHYQQSIPAGGEITIAFAYTHDFVLPTVQSKKVAAEAAVTPPTLKVDAPVDAATADVPLVHVAGTTSGSQVKANGTAATVDQSGNWSADVPLSEGDNRILVSAYNNIGVATSAIVHVTGTVPPAAPPAAAQETTPAPTTTPVVAAKPVRCVVPKLKGKTLRKAKRLLKHAHCRLGKVSRKASTRVKPGRVVKTHLKPGRRVRAGTRVRVTLASKARRSL